MNDRNPVFDCPTADKVNRDAIWHEIAEQTLAKQAREMTVNDHNAIRQEANEDADRELTKRQYLEMAQHYISKAMEVE
jgi:hypothetical protein